MSLTDRSSKRKPCPPEVSSPSDLTQNNVKVPSGIDGQVVACCGSCGVKHRDFVHFRPVQELM